MSRLQVPLHWRTLWATGDVLVTASLDLLLKDRFGIWQQRNFVVDSGTQMTTFPASEASQMNLPMPF